MKIYIYKQKIPMFYVNHIDYFFLTVTLFFTIYFFLISAKSPPNSIVYAATVLNFSLCVCARQSISRLLIMNFFIPSRV